MAPRGRKPQEKKVVEKVVYKPESERPVIFYCTRGQFTFSLPEYERDAFGEIIRNEAGKPKQLFSTDADGNNKHPIHKEFKFERQPVYDQKTGKASAREFHGRFVINPDEPRKDELVSFLESRVGEPLGGVITEQMYKELMNPRAAEFESQLKLYSDENEGLKKHNDQLRKKLLEAGIELPTGV